MLWWVTEPLIQVWCFVMRLNHWSKFDVDVMSHGTIDPSLGCCDESLNLWSKSQQSQETGNPPAKRPKTKDWSSLFVINEKTICNYILYYIYIYILHQSNLRGTDFLLGCDITDQFIQKKRYKNQCFKSTRQSIYVICTRIYSEIVL